MVLLRQLRSSCSEVFVDSLETDFRSRSISRCVRDSHSCSALSSLWLDLSCCSSKSKCVPAPRFAHFFGGIGSTVITNKVRTVGISASGITKDVITLNRMTLRQPTWRSVLYTLRSLLKWKRVHQHILALDYGGSSKPIFLRGQRHFEYRSAFWSVFYSAAALGWGVGWTFSFAVVVRKWRFLIKYSFKTTIRVSLLFSLTQQGGKQQQPFHSFLLPFFSEAVYRLFLLA